MEEPNQPVIKTAITNIEFFNINSDDRNIQKEELSTENLIIDTMSINTEESMMIIIKAIIDALISEILIEFNPWHHIRKTMYKEQNQTQFLYYLSTP